MLEASDLALKPAFFEAHRRIVSQVLRLTKRARTLYEQQDEALKRHFPLAKPLKEQAALKLEFANGTRIVGIPEGADQIRSFHPWGLLMDVTQFPEAAIGILTT